MRRFWFVTGMLGAFAIVCTWGIPALIYTNGDFFRVGIGRHVVERSFNVMEGHGANSWNTYLAAMPFYFVFVFLSFFPWSIKLPGLTKHLWRRLEWISSLGETIRAADDTDWDEVMRRATDAHATRMLGLGLQLAQRVSGIDIPVRFDKYKGLANEVMAQMFSVSGYADSTETNLYNLKIMDRKRDALVSALRAIFVPTFTDWHALNLPSSLHSLYYAYRPLRLTKVYGSSFLQKLTSRGGA